MALINNIPYTKGLDLSKDPLNSAGEHLHNLYSSSGDNTQNLWETPDNLKLTTYYNLGTFQDLNNFDILKWGKYLNPNFASYLF
jgi:hypothetical protein